MAKGGDSRRANMAATRAQVNNARSSAQARAFRARQLEKQRREAEERKLRAAREAAERAAREKRDEGTRSEGGADAPEAASDTGDTEDG